MTNRKFLVGLLCGMILMFGLMTAVASYQSMSARLGFVEGYIRQLDRMLREQSQQVAPSSNDQMRAAA